MALTERQLAVVLQATVERAKERLEAEGGFLPFAARGMPDGTIEFVEAGEDSNQPLEAIYLGFGAMLAEEARAGEILAAALVANAGLTDEADPASARAVAIQIEAPGYCRSIVVPYRFAGEKETRVELGKMIPEPSEPVIYTD